jgi:spore coat polysaccharide biosynthesis protein SpsF
LAAALDVVCFCGSEEDVLGRFAAASALHRADTIVRVCADNPLVAPEEIDRLVRFYRDALAGGADLARLYALNCVGAMGGDYPDGLGAEAFSATLLRRLDETERTRHEREHVTAAVLTRPEDFDIRAVPCPPALAGSRARLDVDTPEDLQRLRRLCGGLSLTSSAAEIVRGYAAIHDAGGS